MQLNSDKLSFAVGGPDALEGMMSISALKPFDDKVLEFFNALSPKLRGNRQFPDVATFGFWCRQAALNGEKVKYDDLNERLGRGVVLHLAPSNVPVNFAFSFAAGLLAGNANIVRLSSKPFPQIDIICDAINELIDNEFNDLAPYMCFVRYEHDKEITDKLSSVCATRVVWGGDMTIAEIRKSPLPPRSTEINFADRHSLALIDADRYMEIEDKDRFIRDFYNDTYYSDQNACTSPRIVFWRGTNIGSAKEDFWNRLHDFIEKQDYEMAPVQSVGKLHALYKAAAAYDLHKRDSEDMLIVRLNIDDMDSELMNYKYNSGFFFEKDINDLKEMLPVCTNPCQTVNYYGIDKEELQEFIVNERPQGIDRFVPIGKSMDFALIWDGYDLIRGMSRRITVV